ncbi:MAG: GNAT family N-acetyltransferase [Anaerohalosphaeraceae bacterium]
MNSTIKNTAMANSRTHVLKNGDVLLVRPAVREDTAEVMEFFASAFAQDSEMLAIYDESPESFTMEALWRRLSRYQTANSGILLTAWLDDKVIGIAEISCDMQAAGAYSGRVGVCVLTEYRGVGIGSALMYSLIGWARNHPTLEMLTLSVPADNRIARLLYEKTGFQEEGRLTKATQSANGQFIDAIMMYKFVK